MKSKISSDILTNHARSQYKSSNNNDDVIRALRSALQRVNNRLACAVSNKPIRDYAETVGEVEYAMELSKPWGD
jgi:hypothetical protein